MNKWIQILVGLILLVAGISVGILNLAGFGTAALAVLKGSLTWIVVLIGLILVVLGVTSIRN